MAIIKINKRVYDTQTAQKVITYKHIKKTIYAGCRQERRTKRTIYCTRQGNFFETWETHDGGTAAAVLTPEDVKRRLCSLYAFDVYKRFFKEW